MNGRLTLHIGMTTARMQFLITCFITTVLVNIVMSQQTLQPEPYIIFANSIDIRRLNFDGTNYDQIVGGLQNVVALDYDIATGYIYWSDHILHKIQRAKIDNGDEIEDFLVDDLVQPDGIALDWKNRRLFFTDSARGVVERIDLDGNNRVVLILGSDIAPRGISVDPHSNWMYFTNVNQVNPTIEKARMSDGTERTVLFDGAGSRLSKPNGITIDYYERMLYWVDAETDKIERSNLNGQNRTVLLNEPSTFHPYGVSQYEDRLYWTDQHQHHIININKKTGRDRVQITGYFTYPTAIHVVHPDRQLGADIDSCQANNGRGECDHICFDQYGTYICACRSGYQLADDDHTCLDINECSSNNGGCSHQCDNLVGTFSCSCIGGFSLQSDGRTCVDTNECHLNNGYCQFSCHNTESSYYCSCPFGYTLESNQRSCSNINECENGNNLCPAGAECVDMDGYYECLCETGYQYNQVTGECQDANECTSVDNLCSQKCINIQGSYRCGCNPGFLLQSDGTTCVDINECNIDNDCDQVCTNVQGSYVCTCTAGYLLNSDSKSCSEITCSQPIVIPGFSLDCGSGFNYLSTCDVACDDGTLVGSNSITCLSNSQWSILTAECIGAPGKTENEPPITTYLTSNVIAEDAEHGDIVGYLRSIDSDITQTFTYFLRGDAGPFYIGSDNTLRARDGIDYETRSSYSVSVLATDNGIPPESQISMIHVLVINVNEAPGTPMWNQNTISENANVGDVVAQLTATDPDHGQILNYTLITNAGGKFSISGTALIVNRPLDYETSSSHQVHIQVRDNGSPILTNSAVFEITVLDENEPPTKITFLGADVKEYKIGGDTVMGTVIGRFQTEDPDQGDTHVYSILNNDNCFNVQGQNLVVNSVGCFDYEANAFYLLDIETMDSGGLTTRTTIRVGLVDVNEPPTGIVLSTSSVMEHADLDTVVGTLTAIDPDAGDTHVFTLVSSSGPFLIDGHSIKVRADMSYEIYQSGISFDVQCTDSAGNSVVKTITVTLQDKNEPPNDITVTILKPCGPGHTGPDNFGIDACITETTVPGDIVAVVHATDPDADDLLTFTMIDASERFIFTNDHQIILGSDGVNYESVSYGHINQITIIATDLSGLTSEKDVTFEITDANDIPSDVRVSAHIVNSATPEGQNFASLTCLDEDLSDTHTFTLLDDSGGRFAVQGNHLQVAQALSVTFTHTRSIIVRCSDNKGAQTGDIQIDLQVTASEGNEDIDIILHDHIIAENSPINTVVGQLSASSSSNPGDTFTFDLMSSGEGTFVLQSLQSSTSAVNLLTNKALDYEDDDTYTITVQVTGTYGMTVQSFTISVTDVNEAPKNLALHNNVVQENINNAVVGIVTAEDPEGDDIDFDITEDPTNSFQLYTTGTRNSKRLVTKRVLDFENQPSMTVVIRAREIDSEGKTSSPLQFLVFVIDVNEPPSDISLNLNSVDENTPPGTIVSYIMVSDPDSDHHLQHFTCILRDDADGMFELQDLTLVVSSLGVLDYEGPGGTVLSIDIECWDQRGLSTERSFDITVNDVNERPTDIKSTSQLFQVKENQDIGEVIAYLTTDDPDEGDTFTYTVTPHTYFAIIADQLITHVHLNYEEKSTHEITLTSTDAEGLTVTKMVTVEVLDTNDPPTGILIPAGTAVNENSPINTLVAELTTIDEDSQQLFSYTLEAQNPQNALKLVDGNKLKVDDGSVINHEKIKALEVTIITRDNGRPTSFTHVETLIIPVLDVNEPPRSITLASDTVVEGSFEGTLIGEIYVDDPDSQNQAFLCTMANNDGNRFELEHNGTVIRLRVGSGFAIDYERVKYHDLILECHDSDLQSPVTGSFRINVLNANDVPSGIFVIDADPSDTTVNPNRPDDDDDIYGSVITSSVATVMENATTGITIVAYVFVTDEDNQNTDMQRQEHFCQLISEATYHQFQAETTRRRRRRQSDATGTDDSWSDEIPSQFMIQSGTNSILVREELNYEDKDEYMIYLECADNGNPAMSTVRSVKIAVLDVDEAPIDIGLSSTSVVENSPEDTHIAHIGLVDPDDTRTAYAYEIISLGVPFYIEETELKISRTPIDHEITPVWTVQIRVIEVNTDLEIIKNFDIDIEPQNEAPDSLTIDGTTAITIPETLTVGSVVGTLEATDPDEDDTEFTFSFFGDHDSHDFFGIEGDKVKLLQSVDAWDNDLYELTVQVTDVGGLSYVGKVTVRLTDVNKCKENDYCSVFAQCLHSVCSCLPGFVGNGFTCTDVDDCANNPCHPDNTIGECQNGVGGVRNFTCNCKEGWLGPDCYREIDDCVNNTCSVVGTDKCVDRLNSYECRCKRGYTGDKCEVDVDDCAENRCLNGGQCIDAISGYKCECKEPFTGINCETDGTICLNVTCPNKGVCIPYSSGHNYACRCLEPFSPDCEGCMYGYGGKDCEPCKPPLTGVNCAVDGSICTPNPCFGHGICVPYLGSKYACICANNYTGAHCEMLNGLKIAQGTDGQNDKFPLNMVYIIIGVSAFLLLIILLICFVWNKRRRVLAQKRMSSHARVRYDPNHQKVEMGPEFQGMEIVQGSEVHDLENPTFFDFEEMMGPDTATSQGMDDEARARMASIANRPIQNPKNNIVSVKVTNDLRAEFNNQGARPRETEPSESRIVTDGRTMQLTSNKNNLGNFETRRLELEDDEDDLKKEELVVDLDHTSVAFQNPVYESAEPALGGVPRRNSETETQEKRKSAKNINTKNSVRDLARKFQTPGSGIQSSQQLTKDNPVYESDEEEDSDQDKQ